MKNLLCYMHAHLSHPAPFLLRHLGEPALCLGSERIAKRLMFLMKEVGIDTSIFKPHSLRGATATHLLKGGVSQDLIQGRGHWASRITLDQYYSRLHQHKNWQELLQGEHAGGRQSAACAMLPPTDPSTDPTKEGESGGFEEESIAHAAELRAHGVLRPLYETIMCPTCGRKMQQEATYKCQTCGHLFHVRCMGAADATSISRQQKYSAHCFLCQMAGQMARDKGRATNSPTRSRGVWGEKSSTTPKDLSVPIIDVMGVCIP